jgi:pimeloyl-ACP methyl ester carboxylesterase
MTANILYKEKNIQFRYTGQGPAIVLLHGFLENMGMWDDFSEKLSPTYRIIAIDLPGFGASECLDIDHSMEEMAAVINEVLSHLKIETCLMVGHSMGGYVTLAFASAYPNKLKGFGLFHSHALPDSPDAKVNRDRAIAVVNSDHGHYIFNFFPELFAKENVPKFKKEIDDLHQEASKISSKAIVAALKGMKERPAMLEVLIEAKVPVLFILGKKDSRIPFDKTLAQTALPSICEVLMLDHVGHMGFLEAPEITLKAIEGFAAKTFWKE